MEIKEGVIRLKRLDLEGPRVTDKVFRGVQIPKLFFKVIAYSVIGQNGELELRAKAFVVSQENLLNKANDVDLQEKFTDEEIQIYQVSIPALEYLTGLMFGYLSTRDWKGKEESFTRELSAPLAINDLSDLMF